MDTDDVPALLRAFVDWLFDECAVPDWGTREELLAAYLLFLEEERAA